MSSATDDKIKTEIEPFGTGDVEVFDKSLWYDDRDLNLTKVYSRGNGRRGNEDSVH